MTPLQTYIRLEEKFKEQFNGRPNILHDVLEVCSGVIFDNKTELRRCKDINELFTQVCYVLNIEPETMRKRGRKRQVIIARHFFCYLVKETFEYRYTLQYIGEFLTCYDHTSVIHAINECRNNINTGEKGMTTILRQWNEYNYYNEEELIQAS